MKTFIIITIGISLLLAILLLIKLKKNKKKQIHQYSDITEINVDLLTLKVIVEYFKSLNLNQTTDTPFIAKSFEFSTPVKKTEGYQTIFIGVYKSDTDDFRPILAYHTKEISEDIKAILGKEELVVLS